MYLHFLVLGLYAMECKDDTPGKAHHKISKPTYSCQGSLHISRKTCGETSTPPPSRQKGSAGDFQGDNFDSVGFDANQWDFTVSMGDAAWNTLDDIAALGLSFNPESEAGSTPGRERFSLEDLESVNSKHLPLDSEQPFNKWMTHLQKRTTQRRNTVGCDRDCQAWGKTHPRSPSLKRRLRHEKSSSGSSSAFVTAVKSASISIASFSIAPRSRKTGTSSHHHRTDHSSKASNAGRHSEESSYFSRGIAMDQAVTNRLLQRRRVLEELIMTEESYVADVKFLMNVRLQPCLFFPPIKRTYTTCQVYVTLMASIPTVSLSLRASIHRNLNEIVELHDELLGGLHCSVPHSEYTQLYSDGLTLTHTGDGHHRWRSLDAVPEHSGTASWLQRIPGMSAEPKVAASVAKLFGRKAKSSSPGRNDIG